MSEIIKIVLIFPLFLIFIFAPLIRGGGVEKNLFIIANYLSNYFNKISIISTSKEFKPKFNKNIKFIRKCNYYNLSSWGV